MRTTQGRLFKRGQVYFARWFHDGKGHLRSTGETTYKNAAATLEKWLAPYKLENDAAIFRSMAESAEMKRDTLTSTALGLADGWRLFLESETRRRPGTATLRQYEIQWSRFAAWLKKEHPKTVSLEAVSIPIASQFVKHLSATRTANTVNKYRGLLAMVWTRLSHDGLLKADNPWLKIQRREQNDEGRRELTVDELRRVCAAATGELRVLLAIGIYTGLRLADAATLRWGEVDIARRLIRRVPSKLRKKRTLEIPIHPTLSAVLSESLPEKPGEYVMPDIARDYLHRRTVVTDRIQQLFNACGIQTLRDREGPGARKIVDAGFHSLRHTFVSMCREANAPLSVVESLVGHANPAMTRLYTHTSETAAAAAVQLLPAVMGETKALPPAPATTLPAVEETPDWRARVRALAKKLDSQTWEAVRKELMALAGAAG